MPPQAPRRWLELEEVLGGDRDGLSGFMRREKAAQAGTGTPAPLRHMPPRDLDEAA